MAEIVVNQKAAANLSAAQIEAVLGLCPFGAIEDIRNQTNGILSINSGCKMCKLCVKKGPEGVFEFCEEKKEEQTAVDKRLWQGIAVYVELRDGQLHPVSLELIGKARELAEKVDFPVYGLLIGSQVEPAARELLHYGVDQVYTYDNPQLLTCLTEPYTNVFDDFIRKVKPSVILTGATAWGRSLAPRVAARAKTGLTADCTCLDIKDNTDLVQIRPAFGGNIMAQIITPNHRPQMATVRYKIFNAPKREKEAAGEIINCVVEEGQLKSRIRVVSEQKKERRPSISDAEIIVAVGRGVKLQKDLEQFQELADLLNGEIACTRPVAEAGWMDNARQIGLSGRTVKPKLAITLGISGSVQFKAGMEHSETIVAVNCDDSAQIFDVSHYAVKGDIYDVVPKLCEKIRNGGTSHV